MDILEKLSKLKNKHCYLYAEQQDNELPFSLEIDLNDVAHTAPYDETYQPLTNVHMGQRKLLLSEIQLMIEYYKTYGKDSTKTPLILYIGSAPGIHLPYLHRMFPKLKFVLYDGAKFDKSLYQSPETFEIHDGPDGFFTTEKALELKEKYDNYDLLFVCDIRLSSDNISEAGKNVMKDMRNQEEWVRILNPLISLLKFRTPYYMKDDLTYMSGKLLYGIWRPPKSTESRLLTHQKEIYENKQYNGTIYEENHFYHNKYIRPFTFRQAFTDFNHYISEKNLYCACFDCYAELTIIKEYSELIPILNTTLTNIGEVIEHINNPYFTFLPNDIINELWKHTWKDNYSIEDTLKTISEEPLDNLTNNEYIVSQINHLKKVLIVIPKVNIYKLNNFETLFNEYIHYFNENIQKVDNRADTMYEIVILDVNPYNEQIYYGALLNSAYTIANNGGYEYILFHEPFLRPNKKMFELYLSNRKNKADDVILYSNIYKESIHPLSVFEINVDIFIHLNGFPNNTWDVLTCYNIFMDRLKKSQYDINYVINNEIDNNSIFYNIAYTDDIVDIRPTKLITELSSDEINKLNMIREKANYDNWCGIRQNFYFHTEQIKKIIDMNGNETKMRIYTISLHNSCDLYNTINIDGIKIDSIYDINKSVMIYIKECIIKYLSNEKYTIIDEDNISLEYLTNDKYVGLNINYGEFIEGIINILEDTYLFVKLLKTDNDDIKKVLELIIKKWCSYLTIIREVDIKTNKRIDPRIFILHLEKPEKLVDDNLTCNSISKLKLIYKNSTGIIDDYLKRQLFYEYDENTQNILKFMLQYNKYTYLNLIVHNLNINKVTKALEDFEKTII
jgi:hypothetical protein